ncbi:protein-glutamate methylesterase/protein-glutamine glutaminase [Paenibacillus wulumuqiensis]|uniref:protein-glutamate methylesterase/protein-glutamine glutaminase n=1 Tax=Paenibacillus wulumuqiensis TaxID=1567107 RepID=UPI0006197CF7|nr:chemotaxis response regulator protein-glutamate methylesterase [Paenibacillus wulumuqiensis]
MGKYGVLIVDDSAFMRRAIGLLFEEDSDFFVVGIARNGQEAIEKVERFKPDIVTMDVEMPEMDGITALQKIMKDHPVPVVMLSVQTDKGTEATLKALELGAVDFFLKDHLINDASNKAIVKDFLERVKAAARVKIVQSATAKPPVEPEKKEAAFPKPAADLIIIGCSTGGPSALQSILPRFPGNLPIPVLVVQHMPPGFTRPLAERFNNLCALHVKEAENEEILRSGSIYIAPAGFQTLLQRQTDGKVQLSIRTDIAKDALYKPSIDITLHSAAPLYAGRLLTAILTGMGVDGTKGCVEVKQRKGKVITESEESCVVYGMPRSVYEAGLSDRQAPLPQIYQNLMSFAFEPS